MKIYVEITGFLSNYLRNSYLTGIQRVVMEVLKRLIAKEDAETVILEYFAPAKTYRIIDNDKLYSCFTDPDASKDNIATMEFISPDEFSSDGVFFDLDNVWNADIGRSHLYPLLKEKGMRIVTQVYDIIPIKHPDFAVESTTFNFMSYIGACLQYSDLLIVSSKAVEDDIHELCGKLGIKPAVCSVVPLGTDFKDMEDGYDAETVDENVREAVERTDKFVLMVGTIEPRKNHKLLIDALENGLADKNISVIFAGKFGWNVAELRERIMNHSLLNKKLFFFERPNDETIKYLYENAFAVAFPTFDEGFGLPVIEALQLGTPVVASDIGVLREVGGDYADYFKLNDCASMVETISALADNEKLYNEKKEKIKSFRPFSWEESGELMIKTVLSVDDIRSAPAVVEKPVKTEKTEAEAVYDSYVNYYSLQRGEIPSYTVFMQENRNIAVTVPTFIQMKSGSNMPLEIAFDKKLFSELGINDIVLSYWFTTEQNEKISPLVSCDIPVNEKKYQLQLQTPPVSGRYVLKMAFVFNNQETVSMVSHAAYIVE